MYYLQSRYYDPAICRFINADSALYDKIFGYNIFIYCDDNPINFIDPTGEFCVAHIDDRNYLDNWLLEGAGAGGYGASGNCFGYGTAYYNYSVYSVTSAYNSYLGGYYSTPISTGITNASYYYVPGAVSANDSMAKPINKQNTKTGKGANNPKVKVAIEKGRAMHGQMNYGPGVLKEQKIAPGCRVDGIDFSNRIIYELKPNNPKAIARGMNQLNRYISAASQQFGGKWTGVLKLYD